MAVNTYSFSGTVKSWTRNGVEMHSTWTFSTHVNLSLVGKYTFNAESIAREKVAKATSFFAALMQMVWGM